MERRNIIEIRGVTKRFGSVVANDGVDLDVREGEILSILGENGSGKTSLMNMLAGIYFPDAGRISVGGREVVIRSPKDAYRLGIGMVHQHFKLVDVLTAAENILLGLKGRGSLNLRTAQADIQKTVDRYGFALDLGKKVYEMSVPEKQTVEIVKTLYRGARILILDEPTAVLTPQASQKLFDVLRGMREQGHSIIIITHKLYEVLSLSDRVSVLRKGRLVGTIDTADATEAALTELMVGKQIALDIERAEPVDPRVRLRVEGVSCKGRDGLDKLRQVSLVLKSGEILGVAGTGGNGQKELLEVIAGLRGVTGGHVKYLDHEDGVERELSRMTAAEIRALGVKLAFVPEDRLGMGLVAAMGAADNMMLRTYWRGRSPMLDRKAPKALANRIIDSLGIVTPSADWPVGRMSGGNVQKVLVGREIASEPKVLMVAYPVRGLDVGSSYAIYRLLNEQKARGVAILCVGEDLDVLLALCDRIVVLSGGRVTGEVDARAATKEEIGLMMMQSGEKEAVE